MYLALSVCFYPAPDHCWAADGRPVVPGSHSFLAPNSFLASNRYNPTCFREAYNGAAADASVPDEVIDFFPMCFGRLNFAIRTAAGRPELPQAGLRHVFDRQRAASERWQP